MDSTFSTPYLTQPLAHGADIVVHSLTKWFGGHGTGIGGVVVDSGRFNWAAGKHPLYTTPDNSYHGLRWGIDLPEPLQPLAFILRMRTVPLRNLGACIAPDNSWLFLQGIETLPLRMERHCENALAVAKHLQAHPARRVGAVSRACPDDPMFELNQKYLRGKGGSMVVFGIKGGGKAGSKFIDSLKLFSHLANVGDAKSLAIHPATTTHSQLNEEQQRAGGITPELVRLSVGIEHIDDILADLDQALGRDCLSATRVKPCIAPIGKVATQFFEFDNPKKPLQLRVGGKLSRFTLAYEMYGRMNADRSNVILLFHAMTGSQHAAGINPHVPGLDGRWTEEVHEGWWDGFIGPGKALDTRKFCVICANYLGGCYGSTGPASINPRHRQALGAGLPRAAHERHRRLADEAARFPRREEAARGHRRVHRRFPVPARWPRATPTA